MGLKLTRKLAWVLAAMALVLAFGLWAWWSVSPKGAEPEVAVIADRPFVLVRAASQALPAPSQLLRAGAVQDPADKAWCSLPQPDFDAVAASEPIGLETMAAVYAASPSQQQLDAATRRISLEWANRLRAQGDERSRAMALYLRATVEAGSRAALVELARHTADPAVYALALQTCAVNGSDCQALDARQWARLDPDNLRAWLAVAGEAQQRGDGPAVGEALHQMGRASRGETYMGLFNSMLERLQRSDQRGLQQTAETLLPLTLLNGFALPAYTSLTKHCEGSALGDSNRAQLCADTVESLWTHESDMLSRGIAASIGQKLPQGEGRDAWAARRAAVKTHMQALQKMAAAELDEATSDTSLCGLSRGMRKQWQQRMQLGEWGMAERYLELPAVNATRPASPLR